MAQDIRSAQPYTYIPNDPIIVTNNLTFEPIKLMYLDQALVQLVNIHYKLAYTSFNSYI